MTKQERLDTTHTIERNWGKKKPSITFSNYGIKLLKKHFFSIYEETIRERGRTPQVTPKEKKILLHLFCWAICSPEFDGDLQKGLYLASGQGFGKDILITTITRFLADFERKFKRFTYDKFMEDWFEKVPAYFNGPIAINDIDDYGKIKKHRESIPFLELLNYREQTNNRRGLIVSTNYKPEVLQKALEKGRTVQKLEQRIIECFNIVMITNAQSKRKKNEIEI